MELSHKQHVCLFCRIKLKTNIEVNIQLSTTNEGNINVEEFIKKSVLQLQMGNTLDSNFLCSSCSNLINELEGYMIKSKMIQDLLMKQYLESNNTILIPEVKTEIDEKLLENTYYSAQNTEIVTFDGNTEQCKNINEKSDDKTSPENKTEPEKTFFCEICGKQYAKYGGFQTHRKAHKNENKFRCDICNIKFVQKINLQRHMLIHQGIHPYQCEICGKRFIHQSAHKIHMAIHSGKRDVKCEVCGSDFVTTSHLSRHMLVHTQEKKFACPECGKRFALKYNMRAHMKKLHKHLETSGGLGESEVGVL